MKITLGKDIKIKFDTLEQFDQALRIVQEDLEHENPNTRGYANSRKYPKHFQNKICDYETSPLGKIIFIPRGAGDTLRKILKELDITLNKSDLLDNTTKGYKIQFKHKFEPRDDLQVEAIDSFCNNKKKYLLLIGSCGFGKTFCALKILEKLSLSTLVLVDENLLLDQWIENIEENCIFDLTKLGIVGKGKEDYIGKDIIIASKDTLINRPEIIEYLNEHIGFVIVDEAHVASADIFQKVLKNLSPSRILGLTATPKRSDGLSYLMHEQIGSICFKADRQKLLDLGSVMNPELRVLRVARENYFEKQFMKEKEKKVNALKSIEPDKDGKYKIGNRKFTKATWEKRIKAANSLKTSDMDWQFLSSAVENDMATIKEISKIIYTHYKANDQSICICRKIEFAKKYLDTLKKMGVKENEIALILGETKSSERMELIEKAKNKELKIIITSSILDKGISIDSANVLFLLYPSKNENSTEQRIGRVSRTQKGKTNAYVYDFIYDHGMFFSQFWKSQKIEYRECRFNVEKECTTLGKNIYELIKNLSSHYYFGEYYKGNSLEHGNYSVENLGTIDTIRIN